MPFYYFFFKSGPRQSVIHIYGTLWCTGDCLAALIHDGPLRGGTGWCSLKKKCTVALMECAQASEASHTSQNATCVHLSERRFHSLSICSKLFPVSLLIKFLIILVLISRSRSRFAQTTKVEVRHYMLMIEFYWKITIHILILKFSPWVHLVESWKGRTSNGGNFCLLLFCLFVLFGHTTVSVWLSLSLPSLSLSMNMNQQSHFSLVNTDTLKKYLNV